MRKWKVVVDGSSHVIDAHKWAITDPGELVFTVNTLDEDGDKRSDNIAVFKKWDSVTLESDDDE